MVIHGNLFEAGRLFAEIASQGPIEAVLVGMGGLLTAVPLAALGYLSLRAGLELLSSSIGPAPPRRG